MSFDFDDWIRQPSTLHGIGVIAGGIGAALAQVTTGNPTVDAVVAVCAYALVHLGINDNSAMQQGVTALTADLVHGASPAKLIADAVPVATGLSAMVTPIPAAPVSLPAAVIPVAAPAPAPAA